MLALSHWFYLPAAFYAGLGILVLRQSLRPSCRLCLNRHSCPNRQYGGARFTQLPVCVRRSSKPLNGGGSEARKDAVSSGNTAGTAYPSAPVGSLRHG